MTYNGNDNRLQMSLLDERTTDTVGLHSSMRAETHQTKRLKYAAMHHQYADQVRSQPCSKWSAYQTFSVPKGQNPLRYPGHRQVRGWSQTCSELEFSLSARYIAAS